MQLGIHLGMQGISYFNFFELKICLYLLFLFINFIRYYEDKCQDWNCFFVVLSAYLFSGLRCGFFGQSLFRTILAALQIKTMLVHINENISNQADRRQTNICLHIHPP